MDLPPLDRNPRTGLYMIKVPAPNRPKYKFRWVSTGETDRRRAIAVVLEFGIDRIVHLANGNMLTAETVSVATIGARGNCRAIFDLWRERLDRATAKRTAETYGSQIVSFFDGMQCWEKPIAAISDRQIDAWVNDSENKMSTAQSRLASIRSLFRYAQSRGAILGNVADLIVLNHRAMTFDQLEKKKLIPFTEGEYQRLVRGMPGFWRDWCVLAYCCGYRMTDCAMMNWNSIKEDSIVVYPKKARRAMRLEIPLSDPLVGRWEMLELAERLRAEVRGDPVYIWPEQCALIQSADRSRLSSQFSYHAHRAGVPRVDGAVKSFHSLRRACAVRLQAEGRTLEQIGQQLGHHSTTVTERYTETAKNLL